MSQPQARIGMDMHMCATTYGVPVPLVPGPSGPSTVLVNFMPAARIVDLGPPLPPPGHPFVKGSFTVLMNNFPALRMGDPCPSAGAVTIGSFNVLTGG